MPSRKNGAADAGAYSVNFALGTAFVLVSYHLVTLAGTSDVLMSLLRIIYFGGVAAQLFFLYYYMTIINQTRAALNKLMADMTPEELELNDDDDEVRDESEYEDDDDEDAEEEEERNRKKSKRRKRDDDDEDEDDRLAQEASGPRRLRR